MSETTVETTRAAPKPKPGEEPIAAGRRTAAEERKRAAAVVNFRKRLGANWGEDYLADENTATVEQIRAAALDALMAEEAKAPTSSIRAGDDYTDPAWRTRAMSDALVHRLTAGVSELPEHAREYRGFTIAEMAAELLELRGISTRRKRPSEIIRMAIETRSAGTYALAGTGDYPFFLQETGQRSILALYEVWQAALKVAAIRLTVRDFRAAKIGRPGEVKQLQLKPEFAEIKAGQPGAGESESYGVSSYAVAFGLSREAMINDDLGMWEAFVRSVAMAVTDLEARLLVSVLTTNAVMSDGYALFSTEHANLTESLPPSITAIDAVRKLMRRQKGLNGTTALNIGPRFLIVPSAFETIAEQILAPLAAVVVEEQNPFAGRLEPIVEARLDDANQHWYLAADPARMPSLAYVVRDGAEGPQLETEYDFDTKGMAMSVVHDFGATAIDWRGLAKSPYTGGG